MAMGSRQNLDYDLEPPQPAIPLPASTITGFGEPGGGDGVRLYQGVSPVEGGLGGRFPLARTTTNPAILSRESILAENRQLYLVSTTTREIGSEWAQNTMFGSVSNSSTLTSEENKISTNITSTTFENGALTEKEKIILISTIVPALAIILILSVLLAYFIFKRQRNARVGAQTVREVQSEQGGNDGQSSAERLPTSQSARVLGRDNNGTTNGAKRAWESEEITTRHETENC